MSLQPHRSSTSARFAAFVKSTSSNSTDLQKSEYLSPLYLPRLSVSCSPSLDSNLSCRPFDSCLGYCSTYEVTKALYDGTQRRRSADHLDPPRVSHDPTTSTEYPPVPGIYHEALRDFDGGAGHSGLRARIPGELDLTRKSNSGWQ